MSMPCFANMPAFWPSQAADASQAPFPPVPTRTRSAADAVNGNASATRSAINAQTLRLFKFTLLLLVSPSRRTLSVLGGRGGTVLRQLGVSKLNIRVAHPAACFLPQIIPDA